MCRSLVIRMISLDCIETIVSFPAILILKSVRKVLSYRL